MALGDYIKGRRQAAILKGILTLIILVAGWLIFQKLWLLSAANKMEVGAQAMTAGNWEKVDYNYRRASKQYAFFLKIFQSVPQSFSLVELSPIEKSKEEADALIRKVLLHYQQVEQKNKQIALQKEKIRKAFLDDLKNGEVSPFGEAYETTVSETKTASPAAAAKATTPVFEPPPKTKPGEEEHQGKWWGDIKNFEEPESKAPPAAEVPATSPNKIVPAETEGVVESSKPSWFNKK